MTLPQRLVDDERAAPWLAERLRMAAAPSPMSSEARARIGEPLAARVSARTSDATIQFAGKKLLEPKDASNVTSVPDAVICCRAPLRSRVRSILSVGSKRFGR